MINYIYNGIELAALPSNVDTSIYQYVTVFDIAALKRDDFDYDYMAFYCSEPLVYARSLVDGNIVGVIGFNAESQILPYACKATSNSWSRISVTFDEGTIGYVMVPYGSIYVWTSHNIVDVDTKQVIYEETELGRHVFASTPTYSASYNPSVEYTYVQGDIADTLRISASRYDTGTLTYQWYLVGEDSDTLIEGETSHILTPRTDLIGTYKYYCVITNTFEEHTAQTATSIATIIVVKFDRAQKRINKKTAMMGWIVGKVLQYIIAMDSDADDAVIMNGVLHLFDGDATLSGTNLEVK